MSVTRAHTRAGVQASAPNATSNLNRVLEIGFRHLSVKKEEETPVAAQTCSVSMAQSAQRAVSSVPIAMVRKTFSFAPVADIGVQWVNWNGRELEGLVRKQQTDIIQITHGILALSAVDDPVRDLIGDLNVKIGSLNSHLAAEGT
eukprot:5315220-Prymnesium_polylepis.1